MANKPFAIQGADLTLGGVNLQAGTTGVVIPGITQATSYKVEEIEDTGDQTYQFAPNSGTVVIDAALYNAIVNQLLDNHFADFTVTTDGDGYIDVIQVNGRGSYTQQESSTASSNDMYAYIGTGSASDRPLIPQDWIQIPFRPKMRAGAIETIGSGGGGGGVVNRTVNYPFGESGDTQGTLANYNGTLYFCYQDYIGSEPTTITGINSDTGGGVAPGMDGVTFDLSDGDNSDISDFVAANWTLIQNGNGMSTEISIDGGDNWFNSTGTSYYPNNNPPTFSVTYTNDNQPQPGDPIEVRFTALTQEIWLDISNGISNGTGSVTGLEGLNGNPQANGDVSYRLTIDSDHPDNSIALRTIQGVDGPAFTLGRSIGGNHATNAIAIGNDDVGYDQAAGSIAIGNAAGWADVSGLGENSIAIGTNAAFSSAPNNSITLNATGDNLNPDQSGLFIKPVREDTNNRTKAVYYNTSSGEMTYDDASGSILGTGSFSTLPDFLDYEPGTKVHAGQNANGVFFSGNAGNSVSYPIRTNFSIDSTTKVVVTLDMVVNQLSADFGVCVFPDETEPNWQWGQDLTRIAAQYNGSTPNIYGIENANSDEQNELPGPGTYQVRFTYDPSEPVDKVKLETLSLGSVFSTVTLNATLDQNYRIGFGADQDNNELRTYIKNLTIAVDGGNTYTDTLLLGESGLSPYVTINGDDKVEVTTDIVFASEPATSSGYIISTLDPNGSNDSYFESSAADSDGVMYTVGYYYGDSNYALVYATNPDGSSKWRTSIDQINSNTIRPTTVICKNNYVFVGFRFYDSNQSQDRVGVVRLWANNGSIDTRWVLNTDTNSYPSIRDVAINNDNEPIIVGRIDNERAYINNVVPLRGLGESGTDYLVVNTADILPPGDTKVGGISWEVDSTGNGDWIYYSDVNKFNDIPVVSVQGNGSGMRVDFSYSGGHPTNSPNMRTAGNGYTNNGNGDYQMGEELKIMGSSYGGVDGVNDLTLYVWTYNNGNNWTVVWPQQNGALAGNTPTDKTYFNFSGGTNFKGTEGTTTFTAGTDYNVGDFSIVSDTAGGWYLKVNGSYPTITNLIYPGVTAVANGSTSSNWSGGLPINGPIGAIPTVGGVGFPLTYTLNVADGEPIDSLVINNGTYTATWNLRYSLGGQAYVWTPNWYNTYGTGNQSEQFMSVAHDDYTGDIYLGGEFYQDAPSRSDAVYKLNSSGVTQWAKYVEDSNSPRGSSFGTVALDATGNYLFVISRNDNGASIVTKLNTSDGSSEWLVKQTNHDGNHYWNNEPRGAVDGNGDVYLTGSWTWDDNTYGLTIHKLSGTDGSLMWARKLNNAENYNIYEFYNDDTQPFKVTNGNIYYAGYTSDPNGNTNIGYALCVPTDGSGIGTYGRWIYEEDTTFGYTSGTSLIDDGIFGATDGSYFDIDQVISLSQTPNNFGNLTNQLTRFIPASGGNIEQVASITFADGSVQTTAPGGAITWTNPNNNVWRIEEYNGGFSGYYDGGDYDAKWFDVSNSPSGDNNFRGAIIQYHAFISNCGTIIGTIHLSNDHSQQNATHTEHLSGGSNLQYATLWDCNYNRRRLYFKMTNGQSQDIMIQWTAKIFYGSENYC